MKRFFYSTILFFLLHITYANVIVLNGLTHIHQTKSGKLISGVVKLKNTKETSQRVVIYFNDLFQKCDEKTILTSELTHDRSIQKWFSTEINDYLLKPKEEYNLEYTVNVPDDAEISGSYWGVLMVEVEEPLKEEELEYSVKLESKIRYGIQIIADVNEKIASEIDYNHVEIIDNEDQSKEINVVLKNLGVFHIQPTITLEVFNDNGDQVKKIEEKYKKIYPNSCKTFNLDISNLPKGSYNGVIVADYGEDMYAIDVEFEN